MEERDGWAVKELNNIETYSSLEHLEQLLLLMNGRFLFTKVILPSSKLTKSVENISTKRKVTHKV